MHRCSSRNRSGRQGSGSSTRFLLLRPRPQTPGRTSQADAGSTIDIVHRHRRLLLWRRNAQPRRFAPRRGQAFRVENFPYYRSSFRPLGGYAPSSTVLRLHLRRSQEPSFGVLNFTSHVDRVYTVPLLERFGVGRSGNTPRNVRIPGSDRRRTLDGLSIGKPFVGEERFVPVGVVTSQKVRVV